MSFAELLGTYGQNYLDGLLATWSMTAVSFVFVMVLAVLVTESGYVGDTIVNLITSADLPQLIRMLEE